jgi:hypothetical protein
LKSPRIIDFLSSKIEVFKMNNISNGQPASVFDFNSTIFTKLKELSFERNSLCGPFPKSWRENGVNVNLKDHSKTLWCSFKNISACNLLSWNQQFVIVNDQNQNVQLQFNSACEVDYSRIQCVNTESFNKSTSLIANQQSVTCGTNMISNVKSEMFLVWSDSNEIISQNLTIYRIHLQYLNYLEGTSSGLLGQNVSLKIKLEKAISKDIHNHLICSLNGVNSSVSTVNNRDDEISCIVKPSLNETKVYLKYSFSNQTFDVSKTHLFIVIFGNSIIYNSLEPKSIQSNSYLGFANKENEILISYVNTSIPRFIRHETRISLNGTLLTPDLPEIESTEGGFISFEAVSFNVKF